jgi:hypothetical protein
MVASTPPGPSSFFMNRLGSDVILSLMFENRLSDDPECMRDNGDCGFSAPTCFCKGKSCMELGVGGSDAECAGEGGGGGEAGIGRAVGGGGLEGKEKRVGGV